MANPMSMLDGMKGQVVFMLSNFGMFTFVGSFFSGFVCLKVPFPLPSDHFKSLLQQVNPYIHSLTHSLIQPYTHSLTFNYTESWFVNARYLIRQFCLLLSVASAGIESVVSARLGSWRGYGWHENDANADGNGNDGMFTYLLTYLRTYLLTHLLLTILY